MTAYVHDVRDVTPAPAGFRIRAARIDEAGVVTFATLPVVGFATTASVAVDGGPIDLEVGAAYLDVLDGAVRPFADLVMDGRRAARILAPDEQDDAHDEALAEQLADERQDRARLTAVPR